MVRLATTAVALLFSIWPVGAQALPRTYRLAVLHQGSPPPTGNPGIFLPALRELGYIAGENLVIDWRYAEGKNERFASLAAELVALKPDTIVADSTPTALASMRATATTPKIFVNVSDPVGSGLVATLARPGGNVTGATDFGIELAVKQLDLLHALAPKMTRIAVLMSDNPVHPMQLKVIQDAAKSIGLTVLPTMAKSSEDFEGAFASMASQKAGAFILLGGAPFSTLPHLHKTFELAAKTKLPGMYPGRWFPENGGLMSYGSSYVYRWRLTATYVAQTLKGIKPADLPVQQPTEFELVINLKAAKALGLGIPRSLLQRADQIID